MRLGHVGIPIGARPPSTRAHAHAPWVAGAPPSACKGWAYSASTGVGARPLPPPPPIVSAFFEPPCTYAKVLEHFSRPARGTTGKVLTVLKVVLRCWYTLF